MIFCVLLAVDEEGLVVLEIHTLGSLYGEASGVVSREGGVQSQKNGLAVGTGNDGVYHVALMELGVHQHFVVCLVVFEYSFRPAALEAMEVRVSMRFPRLMWRTFAMGPSSWVG